MLLSPRGSRTQSSGQGGRCGTNPATSRKSRPRFRLDVESLEDRLVPTVVFTPHFQPTYVTNPQTPQQNVASGNVLQSPNVAFIFAGAWDSTSEQSLLTAAKDILKGPYLSGLKQYGSDGIARYMGVAAMTPSAPAVKFDGKTNNTPIVATFINMVIGNPDPATIYVVVDSPVHSSNVSGFNAWGGSTNVQHEIYLQTTAYGLKDSFTTLFSHEVAEAMAPGVKVSDPGNFSGGKAYQIADNEPEALNQPHYTYRLNGNLVQAYWSQADGGFIVPDQTIVPGQPQQKFILQPRWCGNTFSGKYDLYVTGDQLGVGYNDQIALDYSAGVSGSPDTVSVTENGESVSFDSSQINSIGVDTKWGTNRVSVNGVPPSTPVSIWANSWDSVTGAARGSPNVTVFPPYWLWLAIYGRGVGGSSPGC
jgi:hypothetical protein